MLDAMTRCVLYARQSSGDDEQSESVDLQLAKLKALATARGWEIVGEYSDLDISGKTYPDTPDARALSALDDVFKDWSAGRKDIYRQGLGRLMANLDGVDAILVWDLTRLMRPLRGSHLESYMVQSLKKHNIKVVQLDGGEVDFSSFENSLIVTITGMINDEQIRIQREKQMGAYRSMRDRGQQCSGPAPVGYRRVNNTMEVDEKGAQVVRDAYTLFLNGEGLSRICRRLNEVHKYSTMPGNLKQLLKRPVYCGLAYNSAGDLIPASPALPIISEADWRRAQAMMAGGKRGYVSKRMNALSGLMRCGTCGSTMNVVSVPLRRGGRALTLRCNRVDQGVNQDELCKIAGVRYRGEDVEGEGIVEIPVEPFDRHVLKSMATNGSEPSWKSIGLHEALMPLVAMTLLDTLREQSDKDEIGKRIAEIEMRLTGLHQNKSNLTTLVGDGLLTLDEARAKLEAISKEEAALHSEMTDAIALLTGTSDDDMAVAYAMIKMIQDGTLPTAQYKVLAHRTFRRITCHSCCVVVELMDGTELVIEKIRRAGVMLMPPVKMDLIPLSDGSHRLEVSYYYSSYFTGKDDDLDVLASSDRIKIYSVGHNNRPEGKDGAKSRLIRDGWDRDRGEGLI